VSKRTNYFREYRKQKRAEQALLDPPKRKPGRPSVRESLELNAPAPPTKTVALRLPQEMANWLDSQPRGWLRAFIEPLLVEQMKASK
jgi:hypothetical protein